MRAGADEIEVADDIVAVVGAEPGALGEDRFEAEGTAEMRAEVAAEIAWRVMETGADAAADVGDQALGEGVEDGVGIGLAFLVPVDRGLPQMGHRGERIKGRAAGRGHRRIGGGRVVEVERGVAGELAAIVNVAEQALVARTEQDHVVGDVGEAAFEPEVEHEQRWRIALFDERPDPRWAPGVAFDQAITVDDIAVRGHRVGLRPPARTGADGAGAIVADLDRFDRIVEPEHATEPFEQGDHPGDEGVGATFGEPHAAVPLELVDQRVD